MEEKEGKLARRALVGGSRTHSLGRSDNYKTSKISN